MAKSAPAPEEGAPTSRDRARYLAFGRVLPGVLYAYLGALQVNRLVAAYRQAGSDDVFALLGGPVRLTFYSLFCLIPVAIYVMRPMPRRRVGTPGARAAALVGTTLLLFVGTVPSGALLYSPPDWVPDAAAIVLALASAFEVWALLYLRLNFSIIPEARNLVRSGPYRLIRHPLYSSEILVAVALVISQPFQVAAMALIPFIALQLARMDYEEALLRANFPEYAEYAQRTARLIPFIW